MHCKDCGKELNSSSVRCQNCQVRAIEAVPPSSEAPVDILVSCKHCKELEALITKIHDKLMYDDIFGWNDGSSVWDKMEEIANRNS